MPAAAPARTARRETLVFFIFTSLTSASFERTLASAGFLTTRRRSPSAAIRRWLTVDSGTEFGFMEIPVQRPRADDRLGPLRVRRSDGCRSKPVGRKARRPVDAGQCPAFGDSLLRRQTGPRNQVATRRVRHLGAPWLGVQQFLQRGAYSRD